MNNRKLKLATGIVGLFGVLLCAACYILSLVIANTANASGQETNWDMLGIAIVFIIFGIPVAISAVVEFVFSILYISAKFKRRAFYIVGAVLTILDAFICFVDIYFAMVITDAFGNVVVPIMTIICVLVALAAMVLKILCAAKREENKD